MGPLVFGPFLGELTLNGPEILLICLLSHQVNAHIRAILSTPPIFPQPDAKFSPDTTDPSEKMLELGAVVPGGDSRGPMIV